MKLENISMNAVADDHVIVNITVKVANMDEALGLAHVLSTGASVDTELAAAVVAQPPAKPAAAPKPAAKPRSNGKSKNKVLDTEIGKVGIKKVRGGFSAVALDGPHAKLKAGGDTEDAALAALLELAAPEPAATSTNDEPAAPAPPEVRTVVAAPRQPAPAAAPSAPQADAPADLAGATSFRQVMSWMVENVGNDAAAIEAKCSELRGAVPAIARLTGDIGPRIQRALNVLTMNAGAQA